MKFIEQTNKISIEQTNSYSPENITTLIDESETFFDEQINSVVDEIINKNKQIILLAGPSASGKTTTAKIIGKKLIESGKKATRISLDNFYKNADMAPLWEDGRKNFESIESLDVVHFANCLEELQQSTISKFPVFDFITGTRTTKTFDVELSNDTILIFEGLHALNPNISEYVDKEKCYKIYVSAHSDFVDKNNNVVVSARDIRLTRRCVRDYFYRNATLEVTFGFWADVCKGEELYIRPFRHFADFHVNSTHQYEMFLYKNFIIDMFSNSSISEEFSEISSNLKSCVCSFKDFDLLPPISSLLNEFLPKRK